MITIDYLVEQFVFFRRYIFISTLVFVFSTFIGFGLAQSGNKEVKAIFEQLFQEFADIGTAGPVTLFLLIFFNNTIKSFLMMILGTLFGIAPIFFLFSNGFILGIVMYALQEKMTLATITLGLLPHGIIEIPLLLLSAALGLWLGSRFVLYIRHKESMLQPLRRASDVFLHICIPLFFIAAFIEVYITNSVLSIFV